MIVNKAFGIVFPEEEDNTNSNAIPALVNLIVEKLTAEPEYGKEFYQLYSGPQIPAPSDDFDYKAIHIDRIKAICKYCSFCGTVNSVLESQLQGRAYVDNEGKSRKKSFYGTTKGLWILPSYINHSCWDCNCMFATYGDILLIRSFKNIAEREEILIPYVKPMELYWKRKDYNDSLGFACDCTLCQVDRNESEVIHNERDNILQKVMNATQDLTLLEKLCQFGETQTFAP